MAFPNSPVDGQQAIVSNVTYSYNAAKTAWYRVGTVANPVVSTVDAYTGDGSQTNFALNATPTSESYTFVAVGGVLQPRSTYSVLGANITFSSPPPVDAPVEVTTFGGTGGSIYSNNSVYVYLPHHTGNVAANSVIASGFYFANGAPFISSVYGDSNVASYLPTDLTITTLSSDVAGLISDVSAAEINIINLQILTNSLSANAIAQEVTISTANSAVVSYINTRISSTESNIITANTNMKNYVDAKIPLVGGGGGITYTASAITPLTANIGDQWYNTSINVLFEYTNDGTSSNWVDISGPVISYAAGSVSYGNIEVAAYLPSYNGNFSIANLTLTGNITGHLVANTNGTYDIGTSSVKWRNVYTTGNIVSANLITSGNVVTANLITSDVRADRFLWSNGNAFSSGSGGGVSTTATYGYGIVFGSGR